MTEQELRALVRASVERHLREQPSEAPAAWVVSARCHASHMRLPVASGGDTDGPCIIEPGVSCSHCGYCQSLGH